MNDVRFVYLTEYLFYDVSKDFASEMKSYATTYLAQQGNFLDKNFVRFGYPVPVEKKKAGWAYCARGIKNLYNFFKDQKERKDHLVFITTKDQAAIYARWMSFFNLDNCVVKRADKLSFNLNVEHFAPRLTWDVLYITPEVCDAAMKKIKDIAMSISIPKVFEEFSFEKELES